MSRTAVSLLQQTADEVERVEASVKWLMTSTAATMISRLTIWPKGQTVPSRLAAIAELALEHDSVRQALAADGHEP